MKNLRYILPLSLALYAQSSISDDAVYNFDVNAYAYSEFLSNHSYKANIESNVTATSRIGEEKAEGDKYLEQSYTEPWTGAVVRGMMETLVFAEQKKSDGNIFLSSYSEASIYMISPGVNFAGMASTRGSIGGQLSFPNESQYFSVLAEKNTLCSGSCKYFQAKNNRQYLDGFGNSVAISAGNSDAEMLYIAGQSGAQEGILFLAQYINISINYGNGATQNNPIQASSTTNNSTTTQLSTIFSGSAGTGAGVTFANTAASQFGNVGSGSWFDPLSAVGFLYEMNSDSLFTEIINFPTGFEGEFTVWAEGNNLGNFKNGDYLSFLEVLGHGVTRFAITGIDPEGVAELVDFPIQLAFDTPTATFTQYALEDSSIPAVPETENYALMLTGLGLVGFAGRRNQA